MGHSHDYQYSEFVLEGQFLAFVVDQGKIKYMRVAVADSELQIKLSKQARASLFTLFEQSSSLVLRPWDAIYISGLKQVNLQTGLIKLEAHTILKPDPDGRRSAEMGCDPEQACSESCTAAETATAELLPSKKVKILVCYKSGCQKRGSKKQIRDLEAVLHDRGLRQQVTIQETGCLGKCSMAPNLVLIPGKQRLSGMKPHAIADLLVSLNRSGG